MTETLNTYGYSFQIKVLASLITDREFTLRLCDTLDPKEMSNKALGWLVSRTFEYFKEYSNLPTIDVFAVFASKSGIDAGFKGEIKAVLKDVYGSIDSDDIQFVKDKTVSYCHHQIMSNAILQCADLIQAEKHVEAGILFNKALQWKDKASSKGHDYLNDVDIRYIETAENARIKTGWTPIDDIMGGGLPKGKFGVVIAPTGIGKSWMLCQLGYEALKAGCTVLHYTLELDANYVGKRYDSIATNVTMDELKYNIAKVKKSISKFEGKLLIKEFPPSTLSLQGFEADIERCIMSGIVPDLVILDYPELMVIPYNNTMREDKVLGELYKDLRGVCGRKGIAMWGCDQTNREGQSKDVIENDSVSNSYAKLFALDFVMTVSRRPKDKVNNVARLHVSKNRLGADGLTFPMKFDTNSGIFQVYNENTRTGKMTKSDMIDTETYAQQVVRNQYQQRLLNSHRTEPNDLF